MIKTVIYARVSSTNGTQDYTRQVNDLTELVARMNWSVEEVFAEKISGAKKNCDRKALSDMITFVQSHKIDKVLITELSRLGRDTLQVLETLEILNGERISVYIQNYNIETLNEDKTVNPMSQFLITILAEVARMERKTIRERVASGYKNYREAGGKVGRKQGYIKSVEIMREQYAKETQLLKKGYSLRNIAAITSTSINTLRKIKAMI